MQILRKPLATLTSASLLLGPVTAVAQDVPIFRPPAELNVPRRIQGTRRPPPPVAPGGAKNAQAEAQGQTPPSSPPPTPPVAPLPTTPAPGGGPSTPGTGAAKVTEVTNTEEAEARKERRDEARRHGRFQLDFDKAEIADVVQTISDFTGKLFIVPENIRGKITIVGPEDGTGLVSADEAYSAFIAALEANNWTVYPVGRYLKLVEKRAAPNSNVWTYTDPNAPIPDDERMITKVIRLNYIDTDTVANPLKQLASKDASIIAMPPDTLIVTEVGLNLRRVERILESLDRPGGGDELRVIQVEYANANEIAETILQIFEAGGGGGAGGTRARSATAVRKAAPAVPAAPGAPAGENGEGGPVSITRVIADDRTNKIIVIANDKAFEEINRIIRQLDVPTGDTGRVNVYYLENANAEDLSATLQGLTTGGTPGGAAGGARRAGARPEAGGGASQTASLFAGEVKISPDKATNSLVVVASAQDYKNLTKVIERLDIPRRQVFVEAVIMEVNLRTNNEFGMSVHGGATVDTEDGIAPIIIGSQTGRVSSLNLASLVSLGGFLAGVQGPPVPAAAELGVALPSFGVVMQALTSSSDVNVLSTPHILTSDNEEAEITVGQNVPFQAGFAPQGIQNLLGSAGTQQTGATGGLLGSALGSGFGLGSFFAPIQRQNVELKLKIKPQINESDYIRMEVEEQTEEIAEQDPQLGPTTAKRTAKTVIVAKDQTTVVIGGLIQERTISSVSKTPILGDIPVLGWLFRDTTTDRIKTNLLLFLTPYIIRDQTDFRRIFERKMKERQEFIAAFYGTSPEYEVPIDYERKAGPVALLSKDVRGELNKVENGGEGTPDQVRVVPRGTIEQAPGVPAEPETTQPAPGEVSPEETGETPDAQPTEQAPVEETEPGAPAAPEEAPQEVPATDTPVEE